MRVEQRIKERDVWTGGLESTDTSAQLALIFASGDRLRDHATWAELRAMFPVARLVACSTAGEIAGARALDDSVVATSMRLDHGRVEVAAVTLGERTESTELGRQLAAKLSREGLVHVLVLSDGLKVNGSALVAGVTSQLGPEVGVTGGLSGDGARFERTVVCLDAPEPTEQVVAIGMYGDRLRVGYGSLGGWDPFGPERRITRSEGNVLFELDGEPALDLYKRYLGAHAANLPASGLLFPLAIRSGADDSVAVVRTILSVDEVGKTLTFAGDLPLGFRARLMRANVERLVEGASGAAEISLEGVGESCVDLAILISCVGRKLVLKQRVEEEIEAVGHVLGGSPVMTGFYSYGEISPFRRSVRCELHNQTMTITTFSER